MNTEKKPTMAQHTTMRTGGEAKNLITITTQEQAKEELQKIVVAKTPYAIIGGGSNTIASDQPLEKTILKIQLLGIEINEEQQTITAQAGVPFSQLAKTAIAKGIKGFEWAAGLPGTVGGAIRGNAGCFGGETKDNLLHIKTLHPSKEELQEKTYTADELNMRYRSSRIKQEKTDLILEATWHYTTAPTEELQEIYKGNMEIKKESQPIGEACAGSIFKRIHKSQCSETAIQKLTEQLPKALEHEYIPVSLLIDKGLEMKGEQEGGAQISEKHAGFIVNTGTATTKDVLILAQRIQAKMKEKFDIALTFEIEMV